MRKLLGADFSLGERGVFHGREQAVMKRCFCDSRLVRQNRFFDLWADAHHGIQRSHRLLKNPSNFAPAHGAPFGFGLARRRFSVRIV